MGVGYLNVSISYHVYELRISRDLTVRDLATLSGISKTQINDSQLLLTRVRSLENPADGSDRTSKLIRIQLTRLSPRRDTIQKAKKILDELNIYCKYIDEQKQASALSENN